MKIFSLEDIINLEANSPSMDCQRFPFHFLKVTPTGTKRSSRPFPGVLCLPQPCMDRSLSISRISTRMVPQLLMSKSHRQPALF